MEGTGNRHTWVEVHDKHKRPWTTLTFVRLDSYSRSPSEHNFLQLATCIFIHIHILFKPWITYNSLHHPALLPAGEAITNSIRAHTLHHPRTSTNRILLILITRRRSISRLPAAHITTITHRRGNNITLLLALILPSTTMATRNIHHLNSNSNSNSITTPLSGQDRTLATAKVTTTMEQHHPNRHHRLEAAPSPPASQSCRPSSG